MTSALMDISILRGWARALGPVAWLVAAALGSPSRVPGEVGGVVAVGHARRLVVLKDARLCSFRFESP